MVAPHRSKNLKNQPLHIENHKDLLVFDIIRYNLRRSLFHQLVLDLKSHLRHPRLQWHFWLQWESSVCTLLSEISWWKISVPVVECPATVQILQLSGINRNDFGCFFSMPHDRKVSSTSFASPKKTTCTLPQDIPLRQGAEVLCK